MKNEQVFALDIGTRKVTGVVLGKKDSGYEVLASEMILHSTRAMMDGQIHDVEAVAALILEIKEKLEKKLDVPLKSAAVAAAGRALKTARAQAERERPQLSEISADEVRVLEMEAIQAAQQRVACEEINAVDNSNYFCVGFSVVQYQLENQLIANLVGQVGKRISVEVIATFLPRVVVDSLFSALKRADLEVFSMTLEPIAAISVAIPPNMRLLNLALVDIGAGTSDIAIIKNNSIFAYAMVPVGGDELTEHIAASYLLDFNTAEDLKCRFSREDKVDFEDILDNHITVASSEIIACLIPVVKDLASQISNNILELNQKAPDAVLLVGGGSLTPELNRCLAQALEIPVNRVGVRTPDSLKHFSGDFSQLEGPQGVTPLGIAFHCFEKPPVPFIKVTVNEREIAIWNIGETDVTGALLSSGISLNNMYGKPGMGKTIDINGYLKVFRGEMGTGPTILVNGLETGLDTPVKNGDQIEFIKGENGRHASVKRRNLHNGSTGAVCVNGKDIELGPLVKVNGQIWENEEEEISDRAQVEIKSGKQLRDVLRQAGVAETFLIEKVYQYYLNDQEMIFKWVPVKVLIDDVAAELEQAIDFGSNIVYEILPERPRIKDLFSIGFEPIDCEVTVNGEKVKMTGRNSAIMRNGEAVSIEEEIYNGMRLTFNSKRTGLILSDIFQYVDIKASPVGLLKIRIDGKDAGYTTPIFNGNVIDLVWE